MITLQDDIQFREEVDLADDRLSQLLDQYGAVVITQVQAGWPAWVITGEVAIATFIGFTFVPILEIL